MSNKPTDSDLKGMDVFDKPETVEIIEVGIEVNEEEDESDEFADWPYDKELNFDDPERPSLMDDFEEIENVE